MKNLQLLIAFFFISIIGLANNKTILVTAAHWNLTALVNGSDTTYTLNKTKRNNVDFLLIEITLEGLKKMENEAKSGVKTFSEDYESTAFKKKNLNKMERAIVGFKNDKLPTGGYFVGISRNGETIIKSTGITLFGAMLTVITGGLAPVTIGATIGFIHLIAKIE